AYARSLWWVRWRWRFSSPAAVQSDAKHLEALIADAEACVVDQHLMGRLYERLGWIYTVLGSFPQARAAFAAMLHLARALDDHRLVGGAERGQRVAERMRSAPRVSQEQVTAIQTVFRGAAALTSAEGLYGREEELQRLVGQVTFAGARFLTVWGETGCGK